VSQITKLFVGGIDEAGRGPLAGPVVAAAVVLDPQRPISGLNDSKKLSEAKREQLFGIVCECAVAYAIVMLGPREIEVHNIRRATQIAMERAAESLISELLAIWPVGRFHFLIDGNMGLSTNISCEAIVKGDQKLRCISAASILAKVARDREMRRLDELYPSYGLSVHKGYPTASHRDSIRLHGPSEIHRRTFAGVREFL